MSSLSDIGIPAGRLVIDAAQERWRVPWSAPSTRRPPSFSRQEPASGASASEHARHTSVSGKSQARAARQSRNPGGKKSTVVFSLFFGAGAMASVFFLSPDRRAAFA